MIIQSNIRKNKQFFTLILPYQTLHIMFGLSQIKKLPLL